MPDKETCLLSGGNRIGNGIAIWKFEYYYWKNYDEERIGMLTVVDSKISTSSIQKFRIRMLTEKGSGGLPEFQSSVIKKIYVDFFDKSTEEEIATVELSRDGKSLFTNVTSGENHSLLESTNVHLTTESSFNFKKIGKSINIITDFGVEVTIYGTNAYIRVPYTKYFDNVEGVCGHIEYETDRNACTEI